MKKFLLVSLCTIFFSFQEIVNAQTYISGGIYTDATWTLANSPYIVQDSLTLFPGNTLTIEPGVVVEFDDSVGFDVRGTMNAIGNINDSIIFTSSSLNPHEHSWERIKVFPELGGSINFRYVRVSYGEYGLWISPNDIGNFPTSYMTHSLLQLNRVGFTGYTSIGTAIVIDSSSFSSNDRGMDGVGGTVVISHSFFNNNYYGILNTNMNMSYCTFCGNYVGIAAQEGSFDGCIIINNVVGVLGTFQHGYTITNSTIAANDTGIVFHIGTYNDYILQNNDICSNYGYNIVHSGQYNIDLTGTCWCDTSQSSISASIYDGYDNVNLGLVDFIPFTTCSIDPPSCSSFLGIHVLPIPETSSQNFPNPFSDNTTIQFNLTASSQTSLQVFDMNGQLIQTLFQNQMLSARAHSAIFHAGNLAAGIYYYVLRSNERLQVEKLVLAK